MLNFEDQAIIYPWKKIFIKEDSKILCNMFLQRRYKATSWKDFYFRRRGSKKLLKFFLTTLVLCFADKNISKCFFKTDQIETVWETWKYEWIL